MFHLPIFSVGKEIRGANTTFKALEITNFFDEQVLATVDVEDNIG